MADSSSSTGVGLGHVPPEHLDAGHSAADQARVRGMGARQGMDYTPPVRTRAIKAAGRHTARVKLLKRTIVLGSLLGVSVIALVATFNPFRHLPGSVSIAGVGISGTKITLQSPKMTGVQQGGGPYEIKANAGTQDMTIPNIIELVDVDARVGMSDATTTSIKSTHGTYDSRADTMVLKGDVKIANSSGYTFNMRSALMDFHAGLFTSHERLRVDLKGGEVSADDMAISNNGHVIAFRGNVASTFDAPEQDAPQQTAAQ